MDTELSAERSPEDSHRPELKQDGFDCPHCGRWAHQVWREFEYRDSGTTYRLKVPADGGSPTESRVWRFSVCQRCQQPAVWRHDQMVYPLTRLGVQAHQDMPDDVRALYEEAAAVAVVSRRAGAAIARAAVERLIKHLDPDAPRRMSNFANRIARIKERGVSTSVGKMLDVVRVTGNGVLHVDDHPGELVVMALDDQDGPQLLELLLAVVNDLVDELITKPRIARGLWDKLPAGAQPHLQSTSGASDGSGAREGGMPGD